ncbi:outer membrane beta-barrel protein [Paenimyroides aestuarii]|uniref:Outer membrane beta-barrel protein n=1 Tax=Paenimyroides aestuarii TaxID=2968490 RepID=A0ABY5NVE6_9FLAO|nr:outer membrane beta-barrel protein [Paenimyroides aestuarii]UUV22556.1 outer membrane beta-barrel protein [Paenimyroides aestuarii]
MKHLLAICALLCSTFLYAQKIEVKGKITTSEKKPIEAATVYLSTVKDSTLIDYTITDISGDFSIPIKKTNEPLFLTVSYLGYEDYAKKLEDLKESLNLGTISLQTASDVLDELVITTDAAPIRVKKDTLEFNAASFKVRPDATVKELLEQLPGVEVDVDGKIKVNGKEVNNVLVNGKPFFGADGKVAIENLPKDIINKVQITDTKTKEEKITGSKATSDSKTINLTIDEDKNKGLFGRFIAGYGTDDRYESSLLFNYFKNDFKISVLGSSNNINSQGFSTNEIMDNMSGGRNSYSTWSDDGSFSINGFDFGGQRGISQTDMIGVNYSDNWGKKNKVSMNYLFNEVENNNENKSRIENLLPNNKFVTESASDLKSKSANHTFNYDIEMELDSLTTLTIVPILKRGISTTRTNSASETRNELGTLLNQSNSKDFLNVDTYSFENELLIARRFKRKGRSISLGLENRNTNNETYQLKNSAALFFQSQAEDDIRNQEIQSTKHTDEYTINAVYREPINNTQSLIFRYTSTWTNEYQGRGTFDFNNMSNDFSVFNDLLSFSNSLKGTRVAPSVGYQINMDKVWFNLSAGTTFNNYDVSSFYNNVHYLNNRFDILPKINASTSIEVGKSKRVYANYSYNESSPFLNQLLEYEDLSNPLFISKGNKDLQTSQEHSIYLNFNNYDWQSRSGYYAYAGGSFNPRSTGTTQSFDENFVARSSFINVYDTYNYWSGISYNKSYNLTDKNKLSISAGFNVDGDLNKGSLNEVAYTANRTSFGPRVNVTLDFDKKLTIQPSYTYSIDKTNYKNFTIDQANFFRHKAGLMITSYMPKNVVFGSDVMYQYNSNLSSAFRKDFLLWNASLGYNFFNERFLAKVKVYDILNQNQSIRRIVSPTTISDTQDTILRQYVMFSLTYKLERFAGKKKSNHFMIEE